MAQKKNLALVIVVAFVVTLLTACGGSAAQFDTKSYNFVTTVTLSGDQKGEMIIANNKAMTAASGGVVTINQFDAGQFGNDAECLEAVATGIAGLFLGDSSAISVMVPQTGILSIPFQVTSPETSNWAIDQMKHQFNDYFHQKGLHILGFAGNDFRQVSTTKPVKDPDDLKGLSLRVMENKYQMAYWRALGINPTPLSLTEVYLALQQSMLDGQDVHINMFMNRKFCEVQKNFVFTNAIPTYDILVCNYADYQSLSAANRELMDKYGKDFVDGMNKTVKLMVADRINEMTRDYGVTVTRFSDEQLARMRNTGAPVVIDMLRQEFGNELVDMWIAICAQAEANKDAIIAGTYTGSYK